MRVYVSMDGKVLQLRQRKRRYMELWRKKQRDSDKFEVSR